MHQVRIAGDRAQRHPELLEQRGLGARGRRQRLDRAVAVLVEGDAHRHAARGGGADGAGDRVADRRRAGARRRARCRASAAPRRASRRAARRSPRPSARRRRACARRSRARGKRVQRRGEVVGAPGSRGPACARARWRTMPSSSITKAARRVPSTGADAPYACATSRSTSASSGTVRPWCCAERLVGVEVLMGDPDDHRVERAHVVGAVAVGAELLACRPRSRRRDRRAARPAARGGRRAGRSRPCPPGRSPGRDRRRAVQRPWRERVREPWIRGSHSTPPPSRPAPSASSRRSWRSRRPAATSTEPTRRPRSSRRWRPTRRRSSASSAPRPITPPTCSSA